MGLEVPPGTPDRRSGIEAMCIALMVLTSISTLLRITSKLVVKQYWWWDDFFAIVSLPCQLTILSILLAWIDIGLGLHAELVVAHNPAYILKGAKYLYIAIFFFDASISFPKLAAICFYARVFRANKKLLTINLWIAGLLVGGWLISALISTIFQCTPIEKAWNHLLPGKCINTYVWYLSTASLSSLIDFYILLIPVPVIWRLKVSLRRRIFLLAAFFMAYSVIVLSIGRLISTTKLIPTLEEDLTWKMPSYLYWACLEGSVSLVSVNIPNTIALVKTISSNRGWIRTMSPSRGSSGSETNKQYTDRTRRNYGDLSDKPDRLSQDLSDRHYHRDFEDLVNRESPIRDSNSERHLEPNDARSIEMGGIHVQTEVLVTSRTNEFYDERERSPSYRV